MLTGMDINLAAPLIEFRRDVHAHPELGFAEHRTASKIAEALRALGLEVHERIGPPASSAD
jgi:hippurate hydrolase